MTTNTITIQEFVEREVIYCISPLVFALTQEKQCLDEELATELWMGQINYDECEIVINNDGSYLAQKNELWGLYDNDEPDAPIVDYKYKTRKSLIEWYFNDMAGEDNKWDIELYRQQILEHWVVTPYLAAKLKEEGETVVDLYDLDIYCRPYSGQMLQADDPIVSIYNKLISK